ncbi:pyridoxal phosphate-dependent aminotransferase family protein [archaeon]|nr:MAG: pyridoxal phosphate-dependent aminotransferase family protein [archaeon]
MSEASNTMGSPIGARMVINGREVDYFCGTSYYTLHGHPAVIEAACDATRRFGLGPATNASVSVFSETVELARQFFEVESVAYVISGYLGAMVLVQALRDDYDVVLVDEASHYSVFDGIRTSGKAIVPFRHLDADDLSAKLAEHVGPGQIPLVMSDGVFPVTGVIAPLPSYIEALRAYQPSLLCVDDSHAVGVIGAKGQGTFEYFGLKDDNLYLAGTLSKAFGGIGGIVPGNQLLAEKIKKNVRIPVGASPPPVPAAAAAGMGIRLLTENPEMRRDLWANVKRVRDGLRGLGFEIEDTPVPIVNVVGGPSLDLEFVKRELDRQDIVVLRVPPNGYSDAPDVESLRIAVFSTHREEQIQRLIEGIGRAI